MFGECCAGHDAPGADPAAAGSEPAPLSFPACVICLIASMHPSNTLFRLFFSCAVSSSRGPPPGWPPEPPGSIVSRICKPEAASVVAPVAARTRGPAREVRRRNDCSCQETRYREHNRCMEHCGAPCSSAAQMLRIGSHRDEIRGFLAIAPLLRHPQDRFRLDYHARLASRLPLTTLRRRPSPACCNVPVNLALL